MILGISGQNGRLLTELLLQKNYRVVGFGLKHSIEGSEHVAPLSRCGSSSATATCATRT